MLALLDVGSIQPLHIVLVKDRRHRLDRFQKRLDLRQVIVIQHLRVGCRLIDVVLKNIPAGKDHIIQTGKWNKVPDQRRITIRALAQPNRAHLRQRTDRLRQSLANRLNTGDQCGGHSAHAHHHYSQLTLCRRNLLCAYFMYCHHFFRLPFKFQPDFSDQLLSHPSKPDTIANPANSLTG